MLRKILVFVFLFAFAVASAQAAIIMVPEDYSTIQAAVDAASAGDTIMVGVYTGPGAVIDKQVEIVGNGYDTVINAGFIYNPEWPDEYAAFVIPGHAADGSKISNLKIECNSVNLQLGIFAINADNLTLSHLTITNWLQGVVILDSSGCEINHNTLNSSVYSEGWQVNGILLSAENVGVYNNLIAFNKIIYNGPTPSFPFGNWGIHVVAWFLPVEGNKIVHNNIYFVAEVNSGDPFYDMLNGGIGLGDINGAYNGIYDFTGNYIGFNDMRGSKNSEMFLLGVNPDLNAVSRNLGKDRSYEELPEGYSIDDFKPVIR